MKKPSIRLFAALLTGMLLLAGCGGAPESSANATTPGDPSPEPVSEHVTLMVAAAASLENVYTQQLIPLFEATYDHITVIGTYDSSGKLQTQIESGLEADIFMSAAMTQMNALVDSGHVDGVTVVQLLENKLVLIKPAGSDTDVTDFATVTAAEIIAIGDPESVPAGQYAKEAFTSLGLWDEVLAQSSLGTSVTEVLSWVAEASADVGVVYATDAASTDRVEVIAEAPAGSLAAPVIYPVGMVARGEHAEAAALFIEFLQSAEAIAAFEAYGFVKA